MSRNTLAKEYFSDKPVFHPTFGSRPAQIVGRDQVLEGFLRGLNEPVGSRNRCVFLTGQRGMGKTALLLELSDLAKEHNLVPAVVTAYEGMNDDVVETIQRNGAGYVRSGSKSVQGIEAGALGFSFGLTFNETTQKNYGFRTKLTLLCEQLEKHGKGILLLVDEVTSSEAMRQLGITYQHMVGEERNISIVMAGLPQAVSSVLNDKVLTFLNRALKVTLKPILIPEIRAYYAKAFTWEKIEISDAQLDRAAMATRGYPYLMQLIGYYLLLYTQKDRCVTDSMLMQAITSAGEDMEQNVFAPLLRPLSKGDVDFLKAMAADKGTSQMSDIGTRLKRENSYLQPYRARLIDAGIIESPRRGEVEFAVPFLDEYLRKLC